jgi:hypothetical protein
MRFKRCSDGLMVAWLSDKVRCCDNGCKVAVGMLKIEENALPPRTRAERISR